jgi:hypothetical protein
LEKARSETNGLFYLHSKSIQNLKSRVLPYFFQIMKRLTWHYSISCIKRDQQKGNLMNRFMKLGILILAASFSMALAQPGKVGVDIAATGQLPIGDFKPGLGLGGLAGLEVGTFPGLALTARSGFIYHFEKDHVVYFTQVPIMGGGKFTIPLSPIYVAGELGAIITNSKKDNGGPLGNEDVTNENTNFGWDVGLGSEVGPVDLRLTFNVIDAANISDAMTLGLSVGLSL